MLTFYNLIFSLCVFFLMVSLIWLSPFLMFSSSGCNHEFAQAHSVFSEYHNRLMKTHLSNETVAFLNYKELWHFVKSTLAGWIRYNKNEKWSGSVSYPWFFFSPFSSWLCQRVFIRLFSHNAHLRAERWASTPSRQIPAGLCHSFHKAIWKIICHLQ